MFLSWPERRRRLAGFLNASRWTQKGFIFTGRDLEKTTHPIPWLPQRAPYMLETSLPGVFAVGDARSGNDEAGCIRSD